MQTFQEHFDASQAIRNNYWSSIGELDPDVLTFLVNPSLTGGPMWPALRQSFVLIRTPSTSIIASNGLSDPFENRQPVNNNGFKMEFFVETDEKFSSLEDLKHSWQFNLVNQVSQIAAHHGGVHSLLQELKYLSVDLENTLVPPSWKNTANCAGVLLGLEAPGRKHRLQLSAEEITLVNIKLLTVPELAFCAACKDKDRLDFGRTFETDPDVLISSLSRASKI